MMIFSQMSLQAESRYSYPLHLHLLTTRTHLCYASQLVAPSIELDAGDIHIEGGGKLDVTGHGYAAGMGDGPGRADPDGYGVGGGHGGHGGGADRVNFASG